MRRCALILLGPWRLALHKSLTYLFYLVIYLLTYCNRQLSKWLILQVWFLLKFWRSSTSHLLAYLQTVNLFQPSSSTCLAGDFERSRSIVGRAQTSESPTDHHGEVSPISHSRPREAFARTGDARQSSLQATPTRRCPFRSFAFACSACSQQTTFRSNKPNCYWQLQPSRSMINCIRVHIIFVLIITYDTPHSRTTVFQKAAPILKRTVRSKL